MQQVQDQLDFPIDTPDDNQLWQLHEHRQGIMDDMHAEHTRASRAFTSAKLAKKPITKNQKKRARKKAASN